MLNYLNPALLAKPEWNALETFLRQPFSTASCERVERELPVLAPVYRAMAATRAAWADGMPASSPAAMPDVFMQAAANWSHPLPLVPESLLQTQIVMLEEALRDYVARRHERNRASGALASDHTLPRLDADATRLALHAFSLHEAAFLALVGLFDVRRDGDVIEFSLTPQGTQSLHNRVLTNLMQTQTELSLHLQLDTIIADLRRRDRLATRSITSLVDSAVLDELEERFLDTFFSLSAHMRRDPDVRPLIAGARGLCRWFALLALVRQAGEMSFHPDAGLSERLRLDNILLDTVLADRATALPSDQGIYRSASGALSLGTAGLSHALHCCKSAAMSASQAREVGDEFERKIAAYVRDAVPDTDYLVRRGFKSGANGAGKKYDCDLVLYEVGRRQLFFIQAKWKRDGRTASLNDELHDWGANNWPLTKGVNQLRALRERLGEESVLHQIHHALGDIRLSAQEIQANAHFIVLHTLPYFNAYQIDGVAVYEWNVFRNLLLKGRIHRLWAPEGSRGPAIPLPPHAHETLLRLEDPMHVLDYYCGAIGIDLAGLPAIMENRQQARYGFDVARPDAPWWQRMIRRERFRVLRPYT